METIDFLQAAPSERIEAPGFGREWLVTNGLGGYASGTVSGDLTRRSHGLLVAALPERLGRFMMLNSLDAALECGNQLMLVGEQTFYSHGEVMPLSEFDLEEGLPVWIFRWKEFAIQKRLLLNHGQNTAVIDYTLLSAPCPARLLLRPGFNFRGHDAPISASLPNRYAVTWSSACCEIRGDDPSVVVRLLCHAPAAFVPEDVKTSTIFEVERTRGYDFEGSLYSPGFFAVEISEGQEIGLTASAEDCEVIEVLTPAEARQSALQRRRALLQRAPAALRSGFGAELTLAADQFIFRPPGRYKDAVRARAQGDEVRSVIAGFPWFGDWGRDTMISLEGLTLTTGRYAEAGWILRTFAHHVA